MRKPIFLLTTWILALTLLAGCAGNGPPEETAAGTEEPAETAATAGKEDLVLPSRDEDWFCLCADYVSGAFYQKGGGMQSNAMFFWLCSAQPLTPEDVTVDDGLSDSPWVWQLSEASEEQPEFHYYVLQAYQGQSWKELLELERAYKRMQLGSPEGIKALEAFQAVDNQYWDAYQALEPEDVPTLYCYNLMCLIDLEEGAEYAEDAVVKSLAVTVKGQTKTYAVDLFYSPDSGLKTSGPLDSTSSGAMQMGRSADKNGQFELPPQDLKAKEPVELTGACFLAGEQLAVSEVSIYSDSTGVNTTWDASTPYYVDAGETISVGATISIPGLAGKTAGSVRGYLALTYTSGGEEYVFVSQNDFHVTCDPYALYAQQVDGVDMESYYRDYYFEK